MINYFNFIFCDSQLKSERYQLQYNFCQLQDNRFSNNYFRGAGGRGAGAREARKNEGGTHFFSPPLSPFPFPLLPFPDYAGHAGYRTKMRVIPSFFLASLSPRSLCPPPLPRLRRPSRVRLLHTSTVQAVALEAFQTATYIGSFGICTQSIGIALICVVRCTLVVIYTKQNECSQLKPKTLPLK